MRYARSCALLLAILAYPVAADAQPPPRMPDPTSPPGYPFPAADAGGTTDPGPYRPGSAGPYGVTAESPDPLLAPELVPLGRPTDAPGWYGGFTLGVVRPHLATRLEPDHPLAPLFGGQRPNASLDWTASPRFEIGYRLPDVRGDIRLGYRFLNASGSDTTPIGDLRSHLAVNTIDLDFVSSEWLAWPPPGLVRDLRLIYGVRLGTAFFDTDLHGPGVAAHLRNRFVGAGPRFGMEWSHRLGASRWELYTRFETSGLLGGVRQGYAVNGFAGGGGPAQSTGVAVLGTEAGLAYRPDPCGRWRFAGGYQFEQWWNLGRTALANADLTIQGVFLRADWRY